MSFWELLVVLAIVSILGTVAVSETTVSRVRANVARVRSDMNKAATALETYALDYHGAYPYLKVLFDVSHSGGAGMPGQCDRGLIAYATNLSSPVAYLADSRVPDPFQRGGGYYLFPTWSEPLYAFPTLNYLNVDMRFAFGNDRRNNPKRWYLMSLGPDYLRATGSLGEYQTGTDRSGTYEWPQFQYDPSNGTISGGDILRYPLS